MVNSKLLIFGKEKLTAKPGFIEILLTHSLFDVLHKLVNHMHDKKVCVSDNFQRAKEYIDSVHRGIERKKAENS